MSKQIKIVETLYELPDPSGNGEALAIGVDQEDMIWFVVINGSRQIIEWLWRMNEASALRLAYSLQVHVEAKHRGVILSALQDRKSV